MDTESTKSYLFMVVFGWKYGANVGGCNVGCIGKSTTVKCKISGCVLLGEACIWVEEVKYTGRYTHVPALHTYMCATVHESWMYTCTGAHTVHVHEFTYIQVYRYLYSCTTCSTSTVVCCTSTHSTRTDATVAVYTCTQVHVCTGVLVVYKLNI